MMALSTSGSSEVREMGARTKSESGAGRVLVRSEQPTPPHNHTTRLSRHALLALAHATSVRDSADTTHDLIESQEALGPKCARSRRVLPSAVPLPAEPPFSPGNTPRANPTTANTTNTGSACLVALYLHHHSGESAVDSAGRALAPEPLI